MKLKRESIFSPEALKRQHSLVKNKIIADIIEILDKMYRTRAIEMCMSNVNRADANDLALPQAFLHDFL